MRTFDVIMGVDHPSWFRRRKGAAARLYEAVLLPRDEREPVFARRATDGGAWVLFADSEPARQPIMGPQTRTGKRLDEIAACLEDVIAADVALQVEAVLFGSRL